MHRSGAMPVRRYHSFVRQHVCQDEWRPKESLHADLALRCIIARAGYSPEDALHACRVACLPGQLPIFLLKQ